MSKTNDLFDFYEKEYELVTKSYEFDEDICNDADIFCMDVHTIVAPLANIIAFARERCCNTAQEYSLAVLWNDRFVLHYVFGEYTLKEVN